MDDHSDQASAQNRFMDSFGQNAVIKVIGVGGGGGNAVEHMVAADIEGVDFICANTDAQALSRSSARIGIQLGTQLTKGLGAGANPEVGREAAMEDRDRIADVLEGADMVFVTAGMGGGTGTGAAPVVAEVAKELGILTVGVVTKPFPFEGGRRMRVALEGIENLSAHVDSLITIPNEKLLAVLGAKMSLVSAFNAANDVLLGAVRGIAELITRPGLINVDFADVRAVMSEMGMAVMGTGLGRGENRAVDAAELAIASPLLEETDITGARGVLVNITAGDVSLGEFTEVGNAIRAFAAEDANVVIGTAVDPTLEDEIKVTVVATGLKSAQPERTPTQNIGVPRRPASLGVPTQVPLPQRQAVAHQQVQEVPEVPVAPEPVTAAPVQPRSEGARRPSLIRRGHSAAGAQAVRQEPVFDSVPVIPPREASTRREPTLQSISSPRFPERADDNLKYLDVPAFLRKQAD